MLADIRSHTWKGGLVAWFLRSKDAAKQGRTENVNIGECEMDMFARGGCVIETS